MKRRISFLLVTAFFVCAVVQGSRISDSSTEARMGEVVKLGDGFTLTVMKSAKSAFPGVAVKGEPVVLNLQLEAAKRGTTFFYKPTADPSTSEIYLIIGSSRVAPRAVVEDFPSMGSDNDREVEVLDPKDVGGGILEFEGKGSIYLLFDVPAASAKSPMKLSIKLRTVKPHEANHSIGVSL